MSIYTEEAEEVFNKRFPLIWEMVNNKIAGLQIGQTNFESDGDFKGAKECEKDCNALVKEFDQLIYDLNL